MENKKLVMGKFSKDERGKFGYWFAHWCAYQMTALNLGVWRARYLLHDLEKPFLKLFLSYSEVKRIHRDISSHHHRDGSGRLKPASKIDFEGMIIDWECSMFTKESSPETAREYYEKVSETLEPQHRVIMESILVEWGL